MFRHRTPRLYLPGGRPPRTGRAQDAAGPRGREVAGNRLEGDLDAAPDAMATREQEAEQSVARLLSQSQLAAPAHLRLRVQAMTLRSHPQSIWSRRLVPGRGSALIVGGCLAGAAAAAVVVGMGSASAPPVARAAALALRPPSAGSPPPGSDGRHLDAAVQGVSFPNWAPRWRASGTRSDHLDGRLARTVTYVDGAGRRVGYMIVAGAPLPIPAGRGRTAATVRYATLSRSGAAIVSWRRGSHTCILVSRRMTAGALIKLAQGAATPPGYSA